MSILNIRPGLQELNLHEIPYILEQLNIMDTRNNNGGEHVEIMGNNNETFDDDHSFLRRSVDDRALAPRVSSLENSMTEHINTSIPSLDEIVIRQRGRKKQPAKISWSPVKSPFKTPTKRNSSLHMSLLSPSPAKKLFNNSPMTLRSSPRKRILVDTPPMSEQDPTTSSTPLLTPTKRMRFFDERSMNVTNSNVPLQTLLKGLNQEQLIKLICDVSAKEPTLEESVRKNLPLPDVGTFEEQLSTLRKNITKTSPRSRLLSRTDGSAYSRAVTQLTAFKK
jgi:Cut8, nuclear proteasome tether protein